MLDWGKNGKKSLWFSFVTHECCTLKLFSISPLTKVFKKGEIKNRVKEVRKCSWTLYFTIFLYQAKFQTTRMPTPLIYATFICRLWPTHFLKQVQVPGFTSLVTPMCYFSQVYTSASKTSACLWAYFRISHIPTVYCCFILYFSL